MKNKKIILITLNPNGRHVELIENRYNYYDLYLLPLYKNKAKFVAVPDTKSPVLSMPSSEHSRGTSWNTTPHKLDCGQLT